MFFRKNSNGYIGALILLVVALGLIFTGEIFSFVVGEKTPGVYDPNVKYVPIPLPNIPASNNLQMLMQSYKKVNINPPAPPPPPGGDYCNVSYLTPYFGSAATQAACICRNESFGDPFAVSNSRCMVNCNGDPLCKPGTKHDSIEYSVGLFQANLLSHPSSDGKVDCPSAFSSDTSYTCSLINSGKFNYCVAGSTNPGKSITAPGYYDPGTMIIWAAKLYKTNGVCPWKGDASACGFSTKGC